MANFKEVLFIGDDSDTASTVHCYDLQLGVRVMTYKSGRGAGKKTLSFVGESYVMTTEVSRPFLHVWPMNKEEPVKRMSMPGKVTAMAVSPNGIYCAAGIENKIYIWNVATGQLLNFVTYHHEPITRILFWHCSYLITSGADGLVAVWRLDNVVSRETGDTFSADHLRRHVPFFSSSQHSLPVTDMHLASGGSTARLFTVSADQTCQIYSLGPDGGRFLLTITFDFVLSSIVVDRLQRRLLVGTDCGRIMMYPLEPCRDAAVRHVDCSNDENCFLGHTASVNSLSLSREDTVLASGSNDKKVIIWNLSTRQQIGMHQMFGSVTDVIFRVVTDDFLAADSKAKCLISIFDRTVVSEPENIEIKVLVQDDLTSEDSGFEEEPSSLPKSNSQRRLPGCLPAVVPDIQADEELTVPENSSGVAMEEELGRSGEDLDLGSRERGISAVESDGDVARLRQQNRQLKKINRRLYLFALEQLWQNGHIRDRPRC